MAISRIDGFQAAASSATISVAQGDAALVFAYRSGSGTAPSLPADWTDLGTVVNSGGSGATQGAARIGYRIAPAGGLSSTGTWTNATHIVGHIFRGIDPTTPFAVLSTVGGNNSTNLMTYAAGTVTGANSWLAAFGGRVTADAAIDAAPSGLTRHTNLNNKAVAHSSNGVRSTNWPSTDVTGFGGNSKYVTAVLEVFNEAAPPPPNGSGTVALTLAAAGVGVALLFGSGAAALALGASGAGAATYQGAGPAALALGASGAGATVHSGSGSAGLTLAAQGTGQAPSVAPPEGSGTAAMSLAATGAGVAVHEGSGASALGLNAQGEGQTIHSGSGGPAVSLAALAAGQSVQFGSGSAALVLVLQGVGPSDPGNPLPPAAQGIKEAFIRSRRTRPKRCGCQPRWDQE